MAKIRANTSLRSNKISRNTVVNRKITFSPAQSHLLSFLNDSMVETGSASMAVSSQVDPFSPRVRPESSMINNFTSITANDKQVRMSGSRAAYRTQIIPYSATKIKVGGAPVGKGTEAVKQKQAMKAVRARLSQRSKIKSQIGNLLSFNEQASP